MSPRVVLVVDDSELVREAARIALEIAGWRAVAVEDGADAVDAAVREAPDAVLLDVVMPDVDGPETLRRLRADPRVAAIPVAFLTARGDDPDERAALLALGAVAVLAKPFTVPELGPQVLVAFGWED